MESCLLATTASVPRQAAAKLDGKTTGNSNNEDDNSENESDEVGSDFVHSEESHQSAELNDRVGSQGSDELGELIQLAGEETKLTKICSICQKEFYTTSGLANHMSRHDKHVKSVRELNRRRRKRGLEYVGFSKVEASSTGGTKPIQVQRTHKSGRSLGPACTSVACAKSKIRKCIHFSDEVRQELFDNFWINIDWGAKKSYVRGFGIVGVASRCTQLPSRRNDTLVYHLPIRAGLRVKVCKAMFLATLGIGRHQVITWTKKVNKICDTSQVNIQAEAVLLEK
ncbi:uncharacterized protein LOC110849749 isoform X2 [Folsomia candida]|uniref:uncharacterized protein LOC110849749 isoform X2 n=1 Tax=Folsomia candida TaxID=158441 RepID=UPI001604CA84|nr:uncharacterized protein LOC110849749 isoform X2 [Folsomia candida]